MIKKVFFDILVCVQLVRCAATINIQQRPSAGGYYTLLVDFSMLSESCANETIDVIGKSYAIGDGGGFGCRELNETYSICDITFADGDYQGGCEANGGQFNSSLGTFDTVIYTCTSNSNGKFYTTDVTNSDYPFCAGNSCNESEVQMAYDATLLADANSGELRTVAERTCNTNPFGDSIAYNRYNGGFYIIYMALATISIAVLSL